MTDERTARLALGPLIEKVADLKQEFARAREAGAETAKELALLQKDLEYAQSSITRLEMDVRSGGSEFNEAVRDVNIELTRVKQRLEALEAKMIDKVKERLQRVEDTLTAEKAANQKNVEVWKWVVGLVVAVIIAWAPAIIQSMMAKPPVKSKEAGK